jgi:hypothetical protein
LIYYFMAQNIRWQELFLENNPPYTEYGKVFNADGVTELKTLGSSDSQIEAYAADFYLKEYSFHRISSPPASVDSYAVSNRISAALKEIHETPLEGFLFAQIQQRREGEFSKFANPRLDRFFLQARFTYLSLDVVRKVFQRQLGLYRGILYDTQSDSQAINDQKWRLNDYITPNEENFPAWQVSLAPIQSADITNNFVGGIVKALIAESQPLDATSEFVRRLSPIVVMKPGLSIEEKLEILDKVQYYVFPILGVITFSLDYATDKSVVLRFYDSDHGLESIYTEEKLGSITVQGNLSDYYDLAHQLPPEILYDEDFRRLLKEGRTTLQASSRLVLRSTNTQSSEMDKWLENMRNAFGDQDISPVDADFVYSKITDYDALQIVQYRKTPINVLLSLLEYQERRTRGNLLAYLPYHFAIPVDKRKESAFEQQVIQIFRWATATNVPELLDHIPHKLFEPTLKELLLHARDVHFSSSDPESAPSVLLSLLERANQEFFKTLKSVVPADPIVFIGDIVDQLRLTPLNWEPEQIYSCWDGFDLPVFELYELLLGMRVNSNKEILNHDVNRFWNFLRSGRGLLIQSSSDKYRILSVTPSQLSIIQLPEAALLPKLEVDMQRKLRSVCLKIAVSRKPDSIQFAEWWLFAELGYTQLSVIREDILQLQKDFVSSKLELKKATTFEFGYLVSLGKLKPASSLKKICRHCSGDAHHLLNSTNPALFNAVADIWVDEGNSLFLDDLVFLIQQLPESNPVLAKIASSEQQTQSVVNLDATHALHWLTSTTGTLRRDYQRDGEDSLCKCLLNLKKPNPILAWRILVEEDTAFPASMDWNEYVNICRLWQSRLAESKAHALDYLDLYIKLVTESSDSQKVGLVNRQLIKKFVAKIFHGKAPDPASFTELDLIALNAFYSRTAENRAPEQIIRLAREFLISYLNASVFADSWELLAARTKSLLKAFAQLEHKSIPPAAMQVIGYWVEGTVGNTKERDGKHQFASTTKDAKDIHGSGVRIERTNDDLNSDNSKTSWGVIFLNDIVISLGVISLLGIGLIVLDRLGIIDLVSWLDLLKILPVIK